ncbi:hypothetical protein [Krasilnikovia sp. MM14-A1259]|uniref:hypothetical protein n=1 Tax=Krasilnikovia sp. MM14-A1259 TaxID=3373539 RepID=UPI00399C5927
MKWYADRLPVAVRQIVTDLCVVLWIYLWIRAALWVHSTVLKLGVPGAKLQSAGTSIADNLADVGGKVGRVPVVGDQLTRPFTGASDAARSLADAGRQQQELVSTVALLIAFTVVVLPLTLVVLGWLPLRLRWMRRAGVASRVREQAAGRDLLALRALTRRPLNELTRLGPDIAQSWRDGDPDAVDALAALELRSLGLRAARR